MVPKKDLNLKKKIIELINESNDADLVDSSIYLKDVINVILLYISLQKDVSKITEIEITDFYCLVKREWFLWIRRNDSFVSLNPAWTCRYSSLDEETNTYKSSGIINYDLLRRFHYFPKRFNLDWEKYRDEHVIKSSLPKWKNKPKKIDAIIDLAEMICKQMRS